MGYIYDFTFSSLVLIKEKLTSIIGQCCFGYCVFTIPHGHQGWQWIGGLMGWFSFLRSRTRECVPVYRGIPLFSPINEVYFKGAGDESSVDG